MREHDMSQQIKEIRKHYGLSQQAFARLLGIGEASITRYEKGIVPTKANANLIRAAMIPEAASSAMATCSLPSSAHRSRRSSARKWPLTRKETSWT